MSQPQPCDRLTLERAAGLFDHSVDAKKSVVDLIHANRSLIGLPASKECAPSTEIDAGRFLGPDVGPNQKQK